VVDSRRQARRLRSSRKTTLRGVSHKGTKR
jgi:hypothetical protein